MPGRAGAAPLVLVLSSVFNLCPPCNLWINPSVEDRTMRAVDVIRKKRDGGELSPAEVDAFVTAAATGAGWEP